TFVVRVSRASASSFTPELFYNGALDSVGVAWDINEAASVVVGNRTSTAGIDGYLCDIAFWTRTLTDDEIRAYHAHRDPRCIATADLAALFRYEDAAGKELVNDLTPTLQGTPALNYRRPDRQLCCTSLRTPSSDATKAQQVLHCRLPGVPGRVKFELAKLADFSTIDATAVSEIALPQRDYNVYAQAVNLDPNTTYYWRAAVQLGSGARRIDRGARLGSRIGGPAVGIAGDGYAVLPAAGGSFTTLQTTGVDDTFNVVAGSCTRFDDQTNPWLPREHKTLNHALTQSPKLFVHLGDVFYADFGWDKALWREADVIASMRPFAEQIAHTFELSANFKALVNNTPTVFLVDDHEYMNDVDRWWKDTRAVIGSQARAEGEYAWANTTGFEYKLKRFHGGPPNWTGKPKAFFAGSSSPYPGPATEGAIGSLAAGEWGWDGSTIHYRMHNDSDPNAWTGNIHAVTRAGCVNDYPPQFRNSQRAVREWLIRGNPTPVQGWPALEQPHHFVLDVGKNLTFFGLDGRTTVDPANENDVDAGAGHALAAWSAQASVTMSDASPADGVKSTGTIDLATAGYDRGFIEISITFGAAASGYVDVNVYYGASTAALSTRRLDAVAGGTVIVGEIIDGAPAVTVEIENQTGAEITTLAVDYQGRSRTLSAAPEPPLKLPGDATKVILDAAQKADLDTWLARTNDLKCIISPRALHDDAVNIGDSYAQRYTAALNSLKADILAYYNGFTLEGDQHCNTAGRMRTGGAETGTHAHDWWMFNAGPLDSNFISKPGSPGNEFTGVTNSHVSDSTDFAKYVYMLLAVSYTAGKPQAVVSFVDEDGVTRYTGNTLLWTTPP
ncbi:MAG: alkaline phosphatase D family protein, partial [Rhodospirillales bacterium]